jgi:hypothetical protein
MVSFLLLLLSGDSLIRSCIPAIDNLFNMCDGFLDSSTSVNISPMIIVLQWRSPKHQEAIGLRNCCGRRRIVCALGLLLASSGPGFKFNSVSTGDLLDMTMVFVSIFFGLPINLSGLSLLFCLGDPGATNSIDPSLTISIGSVYPPFLGCSFSDDSKYLLFHVLSIVILVVPKQVNICSIVSGGFHSMFTSLSLFFILQMGLLIVGEQIQHILLLCTMSV